MKNKDFFFFEALPLIPYSSIRMLLNPIFVSHCTGRGDLSLAIFLTDTDHEFGHNPELGLQNQCRTLSTSPKLGILVVSKMNDMKCRNKPISITDSSVYKGLSCPVLLHSLSFWILILLWHLNKVCWAAHNSCFLRPSLYFWWGSFFLLLNIFNIDSWWSQFCSTRQPCLILLSV